ncbi:tRNA (guanosine(37)-N1)-methyltransferase TrmD [Candidatus Vampirococcus lugosii]|uniref:tRNA (guanine-N(1)-)-methyltransferase n=1 Tax=Candidatus Vampirococcus lugosii TaxID=2789015 RepID=A0ABS5QMQ0_9BACT|nr:tRNA (guanosine(37)-N1)-methyltransferase TrmD [Candidatus Vampirococcus lugosii]MBS8122477.1 tRNA (Guanine37-N1) -methyltransferase [Candidatus Vampirococcus lugosii]
MKFHIISIFPEIFENFFSTSIIGKSIEKKIIEVSIYNPRDFTYDKHKQVDDEIYGNGAGMLIKAKPIIDCVNNILENIKNKTFVIIYLSPSSIQRNQELVNSFSISYENIILVSGRYEGIDYRFEQYFTDKYPNNFFKISIGKYIMMGGEVPSMIIIESISRLVPGVIKEKDSVFYDSYSINENLNNLEHPHYTRPINVYGYSVPDILISGNHKKIQDRRDQNTKNI